MEIEGRQVDHLIELRGIYDGWSVAMLADGTMHNRWPPEHRRHRPTQDWIDRTPDPGASQ